MSSTLVAKAAASFFSGMVTLKPLNSFPESARNCASVPDLT
jgi:hypothetical protein